MESNVNHLTAEEFNELFPIGTVVKYYPLRSQEHYTGGRTTTPAWTLGHGEVVVGLDVGAGGYSLDNIRIESYDEQTEEKEEQKHENKGWFCK